MTPEKLCDGDDDVVVVVVGGDDAVEAMKAIEQLPNSSLKLESPK